MYTDSTPRLELAAIQDDIRKLKDATSGAEKACKAFEEVDLAKIFGAANAVSSALSVVALGVQVGLMLAGVPSPEEQILSELQRLSDRVVLLQKRTEEHLDVVAADIKAQVRVVAWHEPLVNAIGRIVEYDSQVSRIRGHLAAGENAAAGLLARTLIESSTARKDLLDHMCDLRTHTGEYLLALMENQSYHYTAVVAEGVMLLRYAALAWHDANAIGAFRIAYGRDPGDASPEPLPPVDPFAFLRQADADVYGPVYAGLAADIDEVVRGMVAGAPQHMRRVADQIIRTGGPGVVEHPLLPTQGLAECIESQLAERWPWLDFAVIANAQFIRVFLADAPAGARRDWDTWEVMKRGSQGDGVILVAAAPRRSPCLEPAVEQARQLALAASGPRELPPQETSVPDGQAVRRLIEAVAHTLDYSVIEREFQAWARRQRTPEGGLMVLVAHLEPYQGRVTDRKAALGGLALQPRIVDRAVTSADRLGVWCEPQCFMDLYLHRLVLGGFTLA